MKILTSIFTREQNAPYFANCLKYWQLANSNFLSKLTKNFSNLLVIDFSPNPSDKIQTTLTEDMRYTSRPNRGFGSNFNAACNFGAMTGYDYLCFLNDDTAIHKDFLLNGITNLEENKNIGFIGGDQTPGGWCLPPNGICFSPSTNKTYRIREFNTLKWEFSACILRSEAIEQVGKFEEYMDPTGYLADNEYLLRLDRIGWECWHSSHMAFWHAKGITQSEYRRPTKGAPDPIREKGIEFLKLKWGIDITKEIVTKLRFERPYNQ